MALPPVSKGLRHGLPHLRQLYSPLGSGTEQWALLQKKDGERLWYCDLNALITVLSRRYDGETIIGALRESSRPHFCLPRQIRA